MNFVRLHSEVRVHRLYQKLLTDSGRLTIIMTDEPSRRVTVHFDQYFLYLKRDESYALATVNALQHTVDSYHWLYRVDDSDLLLWFHRENADVYLEREITHYLIVTSNEIIDVLSECEPLLSFDDVGARLDS